MAKRASDDMIPAAKRLKHNVDAMGCLLMVCKREIDQTSKEIVEVKERNRYLTEQVDRLDNYTSELEGRLTTMEALVGNMLAGGRHEVVESYAHGLRERQEFDMTDLDRLLHEYETEEEEDFFQGIFEEQ